MRPQVQPGRRNRRRCPPGATQDERRELFRASQSHTSPEAEGRAHGRGEGPREEGGARTKQARAAARPGAPARAGLAAAPTPLTFPATRPSRTMPNLKSVMAGPALSAGGAAPSGGSRPGRAGARPRHSGSGRGRGQAGRAEGGRGWAGFGPPPPPRARRTCHAPPPPPRAHQRAEPRAGRDRDTPPTGGDRPIAGRALRRPWRAAASRPIEIGKERRRSEKEPSAGGGASRGRRLRGGRRNVNFAGSFVRAAAAGAAGA